MEVRGWSRCSPTCVWVLGMEPKLLVDGEPFPAKPSPEPQPCFGCPFILHSYCVVLEGHLYYYSYL